MKIIDLTHTLVNEMPIFPQDPQFCLEDSITHENGFYLSIMKSGLHAGTHLDSPYHFYPDGRKVDEISLKELIGTAQLIDLPELDRDRRISEKNIANIDSNNIVILKTDWSKKWGADEYFTENPYLSHECADLLIEKEVKGLGIDGPSVDLFGETDIHEKLLSNDIWIVENLKNLEMIKKEYFEINFIPLNVKAEASFIRAFARL